MNGAAGSMAQTLATNQGFFCNLVGVNNFAPCSLQNVSASATGAGYPINFWQVNPYATGRAVGALLKLAKAFGSAASPTPIALGAWTGS